MALMARTAVRRTISSESFSNSARAGTESLAAEPIDPKASAAWARTLADLSLSRSSTGFTASAAFAPAGTNSSRAFI